MRKNIYTIGLLLTAKLAFSQVIIGSHSTPSSHSMLTVVNKEDHPDTSKGMIIPTAETESALPLYNIHQADHFDDDPTMQGMIMYQKDIKRVVVYDGEKWKPTFYEDGGRITRASMNPAMPENELPSVACILIGCGQKDVPFGFYNSTSDIDKLGIIDPQGTVNNNFTNFTFRESGFYKVLISLKVKTSGLHVSPPTISFRALKNGNVLARNDVSLNEAILITAGANRVGTMEFLAMFDKGDQLKVQVSGGVSILTVADVYKIIPTDGTFISIEKL
ncbi:hypothetical protein [Chryseobacterium gallinarum]|uniref:C1q domain-containing protein n=1 Tax=Chryseobacterium gallinarum TaxID=1324352 RepID=A0A0G3M294_CHRGL|nr:hypothetical protein [Chryseobacterium gallinarum]AKK72760.1 hypothetical protein OK18_09105 [Chryseobacterium gallinarum]MCL8536372.1 hypothetical protein [Chryseobacterium gallinarum]QIY91501.1 hypothetical protein FOB44_12965 [Chryseobacterium gallinarum]